MSAHGYDGAAAVGQAYHNIWFLLVLDLVHQNVFFYEPFHLKSWLAPCTVSWTHTVPELGAGLCHRGGPGLGAPLLSGFSPNQRPAPLYKIHNINGGRVSFNILCKVKVQIQCLGFTTAVTLGVTKSLNILGAKHAMSIVSLRVISICTLKRCTPL